MIMIDRHRRLREPLRWGRREKLAVGSVIACLVLGLAALGVYALTSRSSSQPRHCISVTVAGTLGGYSLHACGGAARHVCATSAQPQYRQVRAELRAACMRAGLPPQRSG
jgi:hypothetical protein